jgi:hypothetical protein
LAVVLYRAVEEDAMTQVVYTVIAAVVSPMLFRLLEYIFKERQERQRHIKELQDFELKLQEMNMLLLECVITNKELSRQARLDAYDEYKKKGGNSWVDGYVLSNLKISEE